MIKVFTLNKNKKIELSQQELEALLNEAYYEGRGYHGTYVYTTPLSSSPYSPYYKVTCTTNSINSILQETN